MPPKPKKKPAGKAQIGTVDFDGEPEPVQKPKPIPRESIPVGCGLFVPYTDPNIYPLTGEKVGFIRYRQFCDADLPEIMKLLASTLSEPYTTSVHRAFLHYFPDLSLVAVHSATPTEASNPPGQDGTVIGVVMCNIRKSRRHDGRVGYIGMLAVDTAYRNNSIASLLMLAAIRIIAAHGCASVVLETETANGAAVAFYDSLGFGLRRVLPAHYTAGVRPLRTTAIPHQDAVRLKVELQAARDIPWHHLVAAHPAAQHTTVDVTRIRTGVPEVRRLPWSVHAVAVDANDD